MPVILIPEATIITLEQPVLFTSFTNFEMQIIKATWYDSLFLFHHHTYFK